MTKSHMQECLNRIFWRLKGTADIPYVSLSHRCMHRTITKKSKSFHGIYSRLWRIKLWWHSAVHVYQKKSNKKAQPPSEPEIAPFDFDPPTPKTLAWIKHRVDRMHKLCARYWPLNYTVTLKLWFGVTQGHWKGHYSIEHIRLCIRLLG